MNHPSEVTSSVEDVGLVQLKEDHPYSSRAVFYPPSFACCRISLGYTAQSRHFQSTSSKTAAYAKMLDDGEMAVRFSQASQSPIMIEWDEMRGYGLHDYLCICKPTMRLVS